MLQTPSCLICHAFFLSCVLSLFFLSSYSNAPPPPPRPFSLLLFLWSSALTLTPTFHTLSCVCVFFVPLYNSLQIFMSLSSVIPIHFLPRLTMKLLLLNALYSDLFLMSLWRAACGFSLFLFLLQGILSWM